MMYNINDMMLYTLYLMLFLIGLCAGSFLNAVIYRLEKGESVIFEKKFSRSSTSLKKLSFSSTLSRSHCPHCRHVLAWYDLIPVLSFLFLRGKCRYCEKSISWQYPIVEIVTGILFVLIFGHVFNLEFDILNLFRIGTSSSQASENFEFRIFTLCYMLYAACSLIVIFVYDLKYYIIPDKVLFPAIIVSIMYYVLCIMLAENYALYVMHNTLYYLGSAAIASGFFFLLVALSRGRWMGMGDVKLAFLMGLVLGWPNVLVALFLAFFLGAAIGVALIFGGSKTLKSQIPFGPFLVAGTFAALFWGERLVGWYWGIPF